MDAVIGEINLDGTIGLVVFGGILPGLLSGVIYVAIRPWLPRGRLGGLAFGALHLVLAATRLDPLRPDNPDFNIVGPGWLSVLTFGAACLLHGMAVAALVSRYSQEFPPRAATREARLKAIVPAGPPGHRDDDRLRRVRAAARRSDRDRARRPDPTRRAVRPQPGRGLLAGRLLLLAVTAVLLVGTVGRSARHRRPRRRHRARVAPT